jgi:O-antigen/teichoic acid export membrane protein
VWIAYGLVVGAKPAIAFLGGPEFAPAVPVLQIQGCAVAVTFFVILFAAMLWILRATRQMVVGNLAGVTAAIILTAALVPAGEAKGAAVAMLIAESFLALWLGIALFRSSPDLRPSLRTPAKVAAGLVVAIAIAFTPLTPLLAVIAGSAAYASILLALRAIPLDVWRATFGGDRAN